MKTVSIIGSFRKPDHYAKIVEIIEKLKLKGIKVLSPAGTEVVDSVDNFVIFSSDNTNLTPAKIEEETLEKIFESDIVYVCDLGGYIGNTTAYEIGRCEIRGKEIYFMEYPDDFFMEGPINVLSPEELVRYASCEMEDKPRGIK